MMGQAKVLEYSFLCIQMSCYFTLTEAQATISCVAIQDTDERIIYLDNSDISKNWIVLRQIA